jgi:probable HAF family extracellular repeat protein
VYSIQLLVGPGASGGASFGFGINAAGDVAGLSYASFPSPSGTGLIRVETGTVWKSAALFYTQPWVTANGSTLNSINAAGDAAGAHSTLNVTTEVGDFVRGGAVYDLDPTVGVGSMAVDINEAGLACGWSHSKTESFVYDTRAGGVVSWIAPLPGRSRVFALGINNSGQVVGTSDANGFLFSGAVTRDLGAASFVARINDVGKVCGSVNKAGPANYAPALCDSAALNPSFAEIPLPMGFDGSHAEGINIPGSVVGSCWQSGNMGLQQSAFIYSGGIATDLNTLIPQDGWHLTEASDINDGGQITGFGTKIAMFISDAGARESIRRTLMDTALGKLAGAADLACRSNLSGLMQEGKLRSALRTAGRRPPLPLPTASRVRGASVASVCRPPE